MSPDATRRFPTVVSNGGSTINADRRRAATLATAVALPVTVILVLLVNQSGLRDDADADPPSSGESGSPTALAPIEVTGPQPSPEAAEHCPGLLRALPVTLDGMAARVVESESPYVAAWGDPPVVFRCGVEVPEALTQTSQLQVINGVTWLPDPRDEVVIWTTVDRPVRVEVTVPVDYASAPVAGLIEAVATLPTQPLVFD